MMTDILPVNFTISEQAKAALHELRRRFDEYSPSDPAYVLSIGWGYVVDTPPDTGNVAIGFYRRSEEAAVKAAIQDVSGIRVVFFTTEAHHARFSGKVLDFEDGQGFFLRGL